MVSTCFCSLRALQPESIKLESGWEESVASTAFSPLRALDANHLTCRQACNLASHHHQNGQRADTTVRSDENAEKRQSLSPIYHPDHKTDPPTAHTTNQKDYDPASSIAAQQLPHFEAIHALENAIRITSCFFRRVIARQATSHATACAFPEGGPYSLIWQDRYSL